MKTVELTATGAERPAARIVDRVIAPVARRRLLASLAALRVGRLTVHLPDGSAMEAGQPDALPHATMWITHEAFFRKFALGGDLGAGESYMDGDWHTDDLCRFTELVLRNQAYLPLDSWLSRVTNLPNDWRHVRRRNSRRGSRRNIGAHYDLSNELFATFSTRPWPTRARCITPVTSRWPPRRSRSSSGGARRCGSARRITSSKSDPAGAALPCTRPGRAVAG